MPAGPSIPQDPDRLVEWLLVAGLHQVQDSELPMQTSDFYSRCMLACKPTGQLPLDAQAHSKVRLHHDDVQQRQHAAPVSRMQVAVCGWPPVMSGLMRHEDVQIRLHYVSTPAGECCIACSACGCASGCLPAEAALDIKKTSYKKLSKLLSKYEKKVGCSTSHSVVASNQKACCAPVKHGDTAAQHRVTKLSCA